MDNNDYEEDDDDDGDGDDACNDVKKRNIKIINKRDEETNADKTITYMKTIYKKLQLKFIEADDEP